MQSIVLTIHLILAALLIGVVLLQRSEGGGLGMGSGGGSGGVMTGRQAASALTRATWILAAGFIVTSITLTIIAARGAGSGSVLDRIGGGTAPASAPASGNSSLPALPSYTPPPGAGQPVTPPSSTAPAPATTAPATTAPSTPAPAEPASAATTPAPAADTAPAAGSASEAPPATPATPAPTN